MVLRQASCQPIPFNKHKLLKIINKANTNHTPICKVCWNNKPPATKNNAATNNTCQSRVVLPSNDLMTAINNSNDTPPSCPNMVCNCPYTAAAATNINTMFNQVGRPPIPSMVKPSLASINTPNNRLTPMGNCCNKGNAIHNKVNNAMTCAYLLEGCWICH